MDRLEIAIGKRSRVIIIVLVVWCSVSAVLLALAMSVPAAVSESTVSAMVGHEAGVDFSFSLRPGKLYPQGATAGASAKKIIASLVTAGTLRLTDRIQTASATITSGSYSVILRVAAGDLWSKDYQLLKQTRLEPAKPDVSASISLPLSLIVADISAIEKQIGMGSPTGNYALEARLLVDLTVAGAAGLSHQYVAAFPFTLGSGMLTPPPTLSDSRNYEVRSESSRINTRNVLGWTATVASWRTIAAISLSLASLAAAGIGVVIRRQHHHVAPDPDRPFRDKIIRVTEMGDQMASIAVRVAGLRELARIADEAQTAIMVLMPEDRGTLPIGPSVEVTPALAGRKYFVITSGVMYYAV